jgi:hypothetical protein
MIELHKYSKRFVARRMTERNRRDLKVQIGLLLILAVLAAAITDWS